MDEKVVPRDQEQGITYHKSSDTVPPENGEITLETTVPETPLPKEQSAAVQSPSAEISIDQSAAVSAAVDAAMAAWEKRQAVTSEADAAMEIKRKRGRRKAFIAAGCVIILAAIILVIILSVRAKARSNEYLSNLQSLCDDILSAAADTEDAAELIHDVWYNCIYEERDINTDKYTLKYSKEFYDDFNDALSNLFDDNDFSAKLLLIRLQRDSIDVQMKKLMDPPDEYKIVFDDVRDFYESFRDLTEFVLNPKGSLSSYTSDYNRADNELLKYYNRVKLYLN